MGPSIVVEAFTDDAINDQPLTLTDIIQLTTLRLDARSVRGASDNGCRHNPSRGRGLSFLYTRQKVTTVRETDRMSVLYLLELLLVLDFLSLHN